MQIDRAKLYRTAAILAAYAAAALLMLLVVADGMTSFSNWQEVPNDTIAYWDGAARVAEGRDLYSDSDPFRIGRPYIYPPAFAAFFALMLPLNPRFGMAVWSASHFLLLGLLLCGLWNFARRRKDRAVWALPISLLMLLFTPLIQELFEGQVNLLVTTLVFFGLLAAAKDRAPAAGLLLAAAAHVKVFPGVALFFLLVQKRFRAAAWMAGGLAVFVLLPWPIAALKIGLVDGFVYAIAQYWHWLTEIVWNAVSAREVGGLSYLQPPNVALVAVLSRMFGVDPFAEPGLALGCARALSHLISLSLLGTSFVMAWRQRQKKFSILTWAVLGIIALQLGNIICWGHHLVLLAIPATVLWYATGEARKRWLWFVAAAPLALFTTIPMILVRAGQGEVQKWAVIQLDEVLFWGTPAWCALLIWLSTALTVGQGKSSESPQLPEPTRPAAS